MVQGIRFLLRVVFLHNSFQWLQKRSQKCLSRSEEGTATSVSRSDRKHRLGKWMLSSRLLSIFLEFCLADSLLLFVKCVREKWKDLTQSYDKRPYTDGKIQEATIQHKNFDYTTIADRLRTVSWSNDIYPTGVVKPVYERSTFPLTAKVV